ncbi:ribbon-helix-helix domain-containing protein [Methanocaldococcus sp. FS406-22]|uniref:ribbon-helix-helix domain-containing protein n=1 Tax=Methanocaldococcus sp. (strain FS406-22) TaxID=644281 RepID=UPI0001BF2A0F|nr:ribbon-helix-helix domain-containing protein [Methanocaldococcus sp. FS406-22]
MPRLETTISEKCDKMLRELAYKKYGGKKGSLSKVIEEAIAKLYGEYYASNESPNNKPNEKTNERTMGYS